MRAAVVTGPGEFVVQDVPDPTPGPTEVVVEVERCGVCGTDLHVLDGDAKRITYPVIPGHELSGRVVAQGKGVATPAVGTLVVVDPMLYCGHCRECRSGWTNLCRNGGGLGTTANGALAQFVAVKSNQCEPVPASVPQAWASLTEPLSCALHALDRIGSVAGASALVLGAGPVGLMLARLLSLGGAGVDVAEQRADRRQVAPAFGAERVVADAAEIADEDGWQVVVDATGNAAAIQQGLSLVSRAGTFAVFGVASPAASVHFSPYDVLYREMTIVGVMSVRHTFGRALGLMASGRIPCDELLAEPVQLEDMATAFDRTRRGAGLKTTVTPLAKAAVANGGEL